MAYVDNNAKSYGDALFDLATEGSKVKNVAEDLEVVAAVLERSPEYVKLLDTPALSREERVELIENAFGTLDRDLVSLLKILSERRLSYMLFKIRDAYVSRWDELEGIERVEAISSIPLTAEQSERLALRLASLTGKRIVIKNTVDPSILGGMKLRYSGKQIDGSLKTRLDGFEQSLKDLII